MILAILPLYTSRFGSSLILKNTYYLVSKYKYGYQENRLFLFHLVKGKRHYYILVKELNYQQQNFFFLIDNKAQEVLSFQ